MLCVVRVCALYTASISDSRQERGATHTRETHRFRFWAAELDKDGASPSRKLFTAASSFQSCAWEGDVVTVVAGAGEQREFEEVATGALQRARIHGAATHLEVGDRYLAGGGSERHKLLDRIHWGQEARREAGWLPLQS